MFKFNQEPLLLIEKNVLDLVLVLLDLQFVAETQKAACKQMLNREMKCKHSHAGIDLRRWVWV